MSEGDESNNNLGGKALKRAKDQVKILEKSISHERKENERRQKIIERQVDEIKRLKEEIKSLRGIPDWVKSDTSKEPEDKRLKKRGPKKGHSPALRKRPEEASIDFDVHIMPKVCGECENKLPAAHKFHSHVQIDIPETTRPIVTKFHVGWSWCKCCDAEKSCNFKLSGSLYGPRLHAFVSFLKFDQGLTLGKISILVREMYGLKISTGVISEMLTRTGEQFAPVSDDLKSSLLSDQVLHADETGWRVDGKNRWLWSFSSDTTSYYTIVSSRAQGVVEKTLGKSLDGTLVSDFYGGYNKIDAKKQRCWAHLLRDVKELREAMPKNKQILEFQRRLKSIFKRGVKIRDEKIAGLDIAKKFARLKTDYQNMSLFKTNVKELKTLCKRLVKFRSQMLTFVETGCEPTNNNAEREIRPAVLMRKTSYQNASQNGADIQAIMMSVIRTAKKRNINFLKMASSYLGQEFQYH